MSITPATNSNFPTYRFYVTYLTITYEVFPLNFNSTSIVSSVEKDQVFYRYKFSGSLLFGTNDQVVDVSGVIQNRQDDWALFWLIESLAPCARLDLTITKTVSGTIYNYWEGYFSTTDGTFDIDRCTFEVTPITDDDYTSLIDRANIQYNILNTFKIPTVVTTLAFISGLYNVSLTRNRWLMEAVRYLASDVTDGIAPGCTVVSTFFEAAINPVTLYANKLNYLTIAQKSDIIYPTSSDPSTTAMMSWTDLMQILWVMFRVRWSYDASINKIYLEHESWFTSVNGLDLTNRLSTVATNKYSYLKDEMPKYEKFSFMEADDSNFVGTHIWYNSNCVNQDPDNNTREDSLKVTTDLEYIINNPEDISSEGFVILENYLFGGSYYVALGIGNYDSTVTKLNMNLSVANLQNAYWRHNRVLIQGYLNDSLVTFWSAQKTKSQKCSTIICVDDNYDPADLITTELGTVYFGGEKASVKQSEMNPSGETKFNLIYGPPDNVNTGVDLLKSVIIQQDSTDCFTLHATLTESDGASTVVMQFREVVYDSVGAVVCTGDWETWTIPANHITDDFTFTTVCSAIPSGGCVVIEKSMTTAGWLFYFNYDTKCSC
jgi:hypothetical protein